RGPRDAGEAFALAARCARAPSCRGPVRAGDSGRARDGGRHREVGTPPGAGELPRAMGGLMERADRPIHVVGGGIAGLVGAITAAEAGAPVVLHEATERLGGRALGGGDRPGLNLGPHVVFTDGALVRWLQGHHVPISLRGPIARGLRLLEDGAPELPVRQSLQLVRTVVPRDAPVDKRFDEWADMTFGSKTAGLLCRLSGLFTYHHEPGSLSAKFVWDRYRRTVLSPDRVRWVAGGWSTLIDSMAVRARALGVRIELHDRIAGEDLPDGPTI